MASGENRAVADKASPSPVAFLLKNLNFGGTQKVLVRLANQFHEMGYPVDVLLCGEDGPLRDEVAEGIRLIDLPRSSMLRARFDAIKAAEGGLGALLLPLILPFNPPKSLPSLAGLSSYLTTCKPRALFSGSTNQNVLAALAKRQAHSDVRLILTEHVNSTQRRLDSRKFRHRFLPQAMREVYRHANAIVGVSRSVSDDLATLLNVPREKIRSIYNPSVPAHVDELAARPVDHPWFAEGAKPVFLSAGRLGRVKDYSTMLRAFASIKDRCDANLLLLSSAKGGHKQQRRLQELNALALELGVEDRFQIHEFVDNPFAYMSRAAAFVLSSRTEGFGNVIAEALACGCPVASTATRGPGEILGDGLYGKLVPIGDSSALGEAMLQTLNEGADAQALRERGLLFTNELAAKRYEETMLAEQAEPVLAGATPEPAC